MVVTGKPAIELGIITAPSEPVYLVMVIARFSRLKWYCTGLGIVAHPPQMGLQFVVVNK
jgi:hypothetical protein